MLARFFLGLGIVAGNLGSITYANSLLDNLKLQTAEIKKQVPNAELYRFEGFFEIAQTGSWSLSNLYSGWSVPGDDLNYLMAESSNGVASVSQYPYLVVTCGGAYRRDCGQPSGQPEDRNLHLGISNSARINLSVELMRTAASKGKVHFSNNLSFVGSTYARLAQKGFIKGSREETQNEIIKKLSHFRLQPTDGLVVVFETINFVTPSSYFILDLKSGKILNSGKYLPEVPRPGAVSSGG